MLLASGVTIGLGLALTSAFAIAEPDGESPILALMPFDGPAGPGVLSDRVVLLLKDLERLEALGGEKARPLGLDPQIVSAAHRVTREGTDLIRVESRYEVEIEGPNLASWIFPVGQSMDLIASVDNRSVPLAISEDGNSATIRFEGSGRRMVEFRRLVALDPGVGQGRRASVPISRAAFAKVFIVKGSEESRIGVVDASEELSVEAGGVGGILGPIGLLEISWMNDAPTSPPIQPDWEATSLWDARPLGDVIRLRVVQPSAGSSEFRLALEPGLVVRRHSLPDVVSVHVDGTEGRPIWVARVDPPLPKGSTFEIELWRDAVAGVEVRQWPAIDLPSAARFTNLIGFRRPSGWSGRLEPGPGSELALEAMFVKAWGPLSNEGLTLSGAIRSARSSNHSVQTGPIALKRSITTKLSVLLSPGRLDVSISGEMNDLQGRSFDLELMIPAELRIDRVNAAGLVEWQRISRERLKLQFDGQESSVRQIQIDGHVPAPPDSIRSETRSYQSKIPWPRWIDAGPNRGTIEIVSPGPFYFDSAGKNALATGVESVPDRPGRSIYRVQPDTEIPPIRWVSPPARVDVSIENEMMIDSQDLTWTASLTCEVTGGPAESLHWKLPTEWARVATLEIEGMTFRLVSQPEGPFGEMTRWTILPGEPIWGRARLMIRARRPLSPGEAFSYPQISPMAAMGRGSIASYKVSISNRSGDPVEISGISGLKQAEPSRSPSMDASTSDSARTFFRAYQVNGDRWSLSLTVGKAGDLAAKPEGERPVHVTSARLDYFLSANKEVWGRATYDLAPRPGPFLTIRLPKPSLVLWAGSDDLVRPVLTDRSGRWIIPLGDSPSRRIVIVFHRPSVLRQTSGTDLIEWPVIDHPPASMLLNVETPENLELSSFGVSIQPIARSSRDAEDFEISSKHLSEDFRRLNLQLPRVREAFLDDLAELHLQINRALRAGPAQHPPTEAALAVRVLKAWASIVEACRTTGNEALIEEALARVSVPSSNRGSNQSVADDIVELARMRRSSRTEYYRLTPSKAKSSLRVGPKKPSMIERPNQVLSMLYSWLAGLAWMIFGSLIAMNFHLSIRRKKALIFLLMMMLATLGPSLALAAPALLAWGWLSS